MPKLSATVVTLENVAMYVVTFAQVPSTTKAMVVLGGRCFHLTKAGLLEFLFALGIV